MTGNPVTEFVHHHERLNGLSYHFVTAGEGPPVLLLHGFPDLWIGWKRVMEQLVTSGYSVIAPDLRGFGDTEATPDIGSATAVDILGDLIALLDYLGLQSVAVVCHDWGAEVGWTIVRLRPDRFGAIVALSVPYAPRGPASLPQMLAKGAPPDHYMLYFLKEGIAEAELDADPATFLRRLFYTNWGQRVGTEPPSMRLGSTGRLIDGLDDPTGTPGPIGDEDFAIYVDAFTRTGFRGALNTYRSLHRNWELLAGWSDRSVDVPALYIGGSRDIVLQFPGMRNLVEAMPALVPKSDPPTIFEDVGHFIQMEKPVEVATLTADFLGRHCPSTTFPKV